MCFIVLKMNFKFYQHLTLHVITPGMTEKKPDATYPVSIVLEGFVLAIIMVKEKSASLHSK